MTSLGIAIRWAHLGAATFVVGAFTLVLLAGRSRWPTGQAWEERVLAWSRRVLVLAIVSGLAALAYQAALAEGQWRAAFDGAALLRLVLETQGGQVWLARHGLLLVLAAFVAMRPDGTRRMDWIASRGEAALLAVVALALAAAGGHAAAVESGTASAIAIDAIHLLAAGAWIGGLLPLALLLRTTAGDRGADARPYAVVATRRFSGLAFLAVVVLVASGIWSATIHVGSVAGLVGTPYGRLLLAKVALLLPILALAAMNRRTLIPALSGHGETVGRPAMRRLARFVTGEAGIALAILLVTAALGITPPARHEQPWWPFSVRMTLVTLGDAPELQRRVLIGSQVALLGIVALAATLVMAARRVLIVPAAFALVVFGLAMALPPMAVDAYPTTYFRSTVPYQATSIAEATQTYRANCAPCHGAGGAGDGPAGRGLPRPPADLRAPHTGQHTAGDLFWWLTHGIPASGMPPFGDRLSEEQRWDLVNFLRALAAGQEVRFLPPYVDATRPSIVAPDFSFTVGPTPAHTLREYRGRRIVLLVLYTLPASRPRLERLAEAYDALIRQGVEVIAVPRDGAADAIHKLAAPGVRIFYPVVTDGAEDIVTTYGLFAASPHAEFLIDRQGYIRARWAPSGAPDADVQRLLTSVEALNREPAATPAADEHVH